MSQKLATSRVQFLIWFLANMLGFGALGAFILVFPFMLGRAGFYITIFFLAIPIGLAQWIALQRSLQTFVLWILTIPLGIPLSFLLMNIIPAGYWFEAEDDSLFAMTSMMFVVGLVIGLLQSCASLNPSLQLISILANWATPITVHRVPFSTT